MAPMYIKTLLKTIRMTLKIRFDRPQSRLLLVIMLLRFMGNQNILDLVETWGFPKYKMYGILDMYKAQRILTLVREKGFADLVKHLQRLENACDSIKSQEAITITVDDFTRRCRGILGWLAAIWWSGADKKPVNGINGEALLAIIGDGTKEGQVITLDYRLVLPHHDGPGAQPQKKRLTGLLIGFAPLNRLLTSRTCICLDVEPRWILFTPPKISEMLSTYLKSRWFPLFTRHGT